MFIDPVTAFKSYHPGNFRFLWMKEFLLQRSLQSLQDGHHGNVTKYCSILATDIRDVYFQDDFFFRVKQWINDTMPGLQPVGQLGVGSDDNRQKFVVLSQGMD